MPKRKSESGNPVPISLASLDAALDLLACETFTRLASLTGKFEAAAGVKLNDGVIRTRWEEAVRRYWVMKGMDDLCCSMSKTQEADDDGEVKMESEASGLELGNPKSDRGGRTLPSQCHPGAPVVYNLTAEEEQEWRKWTPKLNDPVLVELSDDGIWPGKIIDKKTFFQGRTQPRGNHFFCVRIYDENMSPTVTVKSRLLPYHIRPNPPLLASSLVLSAYNHANNPASFDMRASARETLAAHQRSHPGVTSEIDLARIKADKASWNDLVNWVMSERRIEKLRAVEEERAKRLSEVANTGALGELECEDRGKKRKTIATVPLPNIDSPNGSKAGSPTPSIFGVVTTPRRASPSVSGLIRPATTPRPNSPRRYADKRRAVYNGMGEYSPRGRGNTYTPPRILPSGDETAPFASGSPVPTLPKFDFVSPLGPVKLGRLDSIDGTAPRKGSLEPVKEEHEDGWTVVQSRKTRRADSAPCRDRVKEVEAEGEGPAERMTMDM